MPTPFSDIISGWLCPGCFTIYAPSVESCECATYGDCPRPDCIGACEWCQSEEGGQDEEPERAEKGERQSQQGSKCGEPCAHYLGCPGCNADGCCYSACRRRFAGESQYVGGEPV